MENRQHLRPFDQQGQPSFVDRAEFFETAFMRDIRTIEIADSHEFAQNFQKNLIEFKKSFRENALKIYIGNLGTAISALINAFETNQDENKATVFFYAIKEIALEFIDCGYFKRLCEITPQLLSFIDAAEVDGSNPDLAQGKNRIDQIKPHILSLDYYNLLDLYTKYISYKADFLPYFNSNEGLSYLCKRKFDDEAMAQSLINESQGFVEYLAEKPRPPKIVANHLLRQASQSSVRTARKTHLEDPSSPAKVDENEELENDVFFPDGVTIPATPLPAESEKFRYAEDGEQFRYNLETEAEILGRDLLAQINPSRNITRRGLPKSLSTPNIKIRENT